MRLFIDCEFNGYKGDLISIALVSEDNKEFYEVLQCDKPVSWVKENVIPKLYNIPISLSELQKRLEKFLMQFKSIELIADWPEDIQHFCECLITGPGYRINTPPLTIQIFRFDSNSEDPHNALADARGIAKYFKENV